MAVDPDIIAPPSRTPSKHYARHRFHFPLPETWWCHRATNTRTRLRVEEHPLPESEHFPSVGMEPAWVMRLKGAVSLRVSNRSGPVGAVVPVQLVPQIFGASPAKAMSSSAKQEAFNQERCYNSLK